jgi:hypothetical protein
MQTLATVIGFASGFALMGYRESAANLLATSLAIDASLAPLTAVAASRRGRQAIVWAILGFAFGVWALAAVLLIPRRNPGGSDFPPTSDAA